VALAGDAEASQHTAPLQWGPAQPSPFKPGPGSIFVPGAWPTPHGKQHQHQRQHQQPPPQQQLQRRSSSNMYGMPQLQVAGVPLLRPQAPAAAGVAYPCLSLQAIGARGAVAVHHVSFMEQLSAAVQVQPPAFYVPPLVQQPHPQQLVLQQVRGWIAGWLTAGGGRFDRTAVCC